MAISKKIVDTRKFNENNKARLGRGGDTEIRKVDGKKSHVNALEAYLIDVNGKAGEEYAKRVGAGTVNPLTGMSEYHEGDHTHANHKTHAMITKTDDLGNSIQTEDYSQPLFTSTELAAPGAQDVLQTAIATYSPGEGQLGYEGYSGLSDTERQGYLGEFDITVDKLKYISPLETKPFELLKKGAGLEREKLEATLGRGYQEAATASQQATSQSRLATSGTIAADFGKQMRGLTQDYQAGMKGTQFGLEQDIYAEQQRQMEKLWGQIGTVSQG